MMTTNTKPPEFSWAVPKELGIPPDPLRLRLDFHHQSTVMTFFQEGSTVVRLVDAMEVAHALASNLTFGTGLLPSGTIWWQNTRSGPIFALYVEPKVWKLALQGGDMKKAPRRFTIPLPGFIFLCTHGQPPWVYAVKKKPTKERDTVYKAPLANIFANGRSCPGSHAYPNRIADIVPSFFTSFFSSTADLHNRSKRFPSNVISLWHFLHGKKRFPMEDLVEFGIIADLMNIGVSGNEL